ncbi:hypothetical protein COMA2_30285 [Candidatus Nitrospira nitrificans]|uniref:Uncharacterized protein n=1 Tax=Candidatus Nitrospira nitrificans TaxID=1742973 RepID=A0A0S4LIX4_9BACT|nr:hypothetical protein COMA2_30285 [Candidatus Nitrospira nitrificans]
MRSLSATICARIALRRRSRLSGVFDLPENVDFAVLLKQRAAFWPIYVLHFTHADKWRVAYDFAPLKSDFLRSVVDA